MIGERMKPRTKIAAWVWIALSVAGVAEGIVWHLNVPPGTSAVTRSIPMLVLGEATSGFLIFCGFMLLRRRRCAWWVVVVVGALEITTPFIELSQRATTHPLQTMAVFGSLGPWITWGSAALEALVVLALLLDYPDKWRTSEGQPLFAPPSGPRLRITTVLLAWFWIFLGAGYALEPTAATLVALSTVGVPVNNRTFALFMLLFGIIAGGALVWAAVAMLKRRAWGWWVLVLFSAAWVIVPLPRHQWGVAALALLSCVGLLFDQPKRWAQAKPKEPQP